MKLGVEYFEPNRCRNPKCRESLVREPYSPLDKMIPAKVRTGRWLCPSCKYLGSRAFALGAVLAGVVWGVAKLLVKFL